jgi:peptide/nickel transport system substrate-binding protein
VLAEEVYLTQLQDDQEITLVSSAGGGSGTEIMLLNFTDPTRKTADGERSSLQFPHPFLSDWNVRQAITLAIDREALQAIYGFIGTPTSNLVDTPPVYVSPNTAYQYNPERAAQLLNEAGWVDSNGDGIREKDGISLHVVYQTSVNVNRQKVQNLIRGNLEAVGFSVDLQAIDSSIFFSSDPENLNSSTQFYADLQVWAGGSEDPDPANSWLGLFTCAQIPQRANNWSGYNTGRYCNPEYEELYQQVSGETDPEKRRELIIAMNDLLIEDGAVIPLVSRLSLNGMKSDLIGFSFTPWDVEVWNIADWRRSE